MDQIFNELSLSGEYPDKYPAHAGMINVYHASKALCDLGYSKAIRTTADFRTRMLSPEYTIAQWFTDKDFNAQREERTYLLTCLQKSPYVEELYGKENVDGATEYVFNGQTALGLALAFLWKSTAISLPLGGISSPSVMLNFLEYDSDLKETTKSCSVPVVCSKEHVETIKDSIKEQILSTVSLCTGVDIIQHSSALFPNIEFCDNALKQLQEMTGKEIFFPIVLRHLQVFQKTMEGYTGGRFAPRNINYAATESATTSVHPKAKAARTFYCPDGKKRIFLAHSKIGIDFRRIHVFLDYENKKLYIGHIGEHLPLA